MTVQGAPIERVETECFRFPTEQPEEDGTFRWQATTVVAVRLTAGGRTGLGWTYSAAAAGALIDEQLAEVVRDRSAFDVAAGWSAMHRAVRNIGNRGLAMQAISALDVAWWDLKAQLLDVRLVDLLGRCRDAVPVYGSGGFTNLTDEQLAEQVAGWSAAGCRSMKIKIGEHWGTDTDRDLRRVRRLRELAGPDVQLMVDANGGYSIGQARRVGELLDEYGVIWFEEPVSSDDVAGLTELRGWLSCDVAAGEYIADVYEAARLLPAVDCLQLDVTRCGGYTGWLRAADLALAHNREVSGHCAPALHAAVAAAVPHLRHVEWFADHARLEPLLVDGCP
ncbi:MAG TPA: enolase C-terminal domain-like protein, partial [Jatrophihabitans sp.]|nr:enolase C-terminal domain-like protein [Jatrophihabitans sp.]